MRTTLTLDDDVAVQLEKRRKQSGQTWKAVVNETLRRGLAHPDGRPVTREVYRTPGSSLGRCRLGSVDSVAEALAAAEGDGFG